MADDNKDEAQELTPQQKMARRYPQPVRVGDLIGLPVLDYDDITIGHVRRVIRKPDDSIALIVSYGSWFTLTKRPVAVPIETVAILAKQINALEFTRDDFDEAPAWSDAQGHDIAAGETIRIAIGRR